MSPARFKQNALGTNFRAVKAVVLFALLTLQQVAASAPLFDFSELKKHVDCDLSLTGKPLTVVAGLGNVGSEMTRHNVGQDLLKDWLIQNRATSFSNYEHWITIELKSEEQAIEYVEFSYASSPQRDGTKVTFRVGGEVYLLPQGSELGNAAPILFALPYYDINESGYFIGELAQAFKLAPQQILILIDDIQLNRMQITLTKGKSAPKENVHPSRDKFDDGHNGLKSINAHLGQGDYWRFRFGVSSPRQEKLEGSLVDWVLGPLSDEDREYLWRNETRQILSRVFLSHNRLQSLPSDEQQKATGDFISLGKNLTRKP